MNEHTPGPWHYDDQDYVISYFFDEEEYVLAELVSANDFDGYLIAAAPKMKEVLKKFKFLPDCGGDFCDEVTNPIMNGDYASCCHWGYCRWAYEYQKEVDQVLKGVNQNV